MANTADDGLERLEHEALATGRGAHCLRAQPGVHICMERMDSQVALSCMRTCMAPVRRAREEHHSTMNGTAQMERVCGCPNHKHIISAAARARMCCVSLCETRLTARLTRHACGRGCNSSAAGQRALSGSRIHAVPGVRRASFFAKSFSSCSPPAPLRSRETRRRGLSGRDVDGAASRPPCRRSRAFFHLL